MADGQDKGHAALRGWGPPPRALPAGRGPHTIAFSPRRGTRSMRLRFAAFAAILAFLAAPPFAVTAAPAGQVLALFGPCFIETGGHKAALKFGDPVHVGDAVDVAAGGKLKLRMADGSIIAVASNTRLTIKNYAIARNGAGRQAALSLAHGLLRAVVSPLKGGSHQVRTRPRWFAPLGRCK
ncbi:MAG TPA: FecR domain-containing protein [Stellaceae bacterium]|nr:FecR domain-containing protein [Stellaceae bacterium]